MKQRYLDRLFAVVVLTLALGLLAVSLSYDAASALFPRALCMLLVILAVLQIGRSRSVLSLEPEAAPLAQAAFLLCAVLAWVGLVRLVNIELATLLFTLLSLRLLGMRNWLWNWNTAAGLMLLVHLLFFQLLDVTRPQSWWL